MSLNQQHQWGAFHGNDRDEERHRQDRLDFYANCPDHDYRTWSGNPMILRCTKCQDWYYKTSLDLY